MDYYNYNLLPNEMKNENKGVARELKKYVKQDFE